MYVYRIISEHILNSAHVPKKTHQVIIKNAWDIWLSFFQEIRNQTYLPQNFHLEFNIHGGFA